MAKNQLNCQASKLIIDYHAAWKDKLKLMLIKDKAWSVIVEEAPNSVDSKWKEKDEQVFATIGLMVEDNQLGHIRDVMTAGAA